MNENTLKLIAAIADGDALETEQSFQTAMAERISTKLDVMREQISQSMFTTPEVVAEDNHDKDDEDEDDEDKDDEDKDDEEDEDEDKDNKK